ncbi:MAG: 4-amino-4-deoxy-L-arabinose transferase and related glycosyltransferase of family-like protein [Streptosporangiaceae bacterium]|nr:4-amino-4-deoxy-L-arabinose transferase and related glycosyltransferase of family-like protein [Streptosporangiaceae bacterium]
MSAQTFPTGTAPRPGDGGPPSPRRAGLLRRAVLGRPEDPRWARPALWGVLLLAAVLHTWRLSANGDANAYYAAAVLSATKSWKAFFFGSLDAGSFITVDKPPMALWLMALSGRIFGFDSWSLLLPQAAAGTATVGVLYTAVRRGMGESFGRHGAPTAATVAALALALTPITVAIDRDNNPDTLLVLLLVVAAWACLTAIRTGRLLPLLGSAAVIGCAFNTKMLQAYLVLPGLAAAYLLFAPGGLVRRLARLALAGVTLVVSSFWWMLVVDRIPQGSRPYIGGSQNDTVWDLVIGYNGLGRILGRTGGRTAAGPWGHGGGGPSFGGAPGLGRLFGQIVGGQISWLVPFAVVALVAGLALRGRAPRTDLARASLALWGGWLAVHFVVFSFARGTFHPYYTTAMAPTIAALTGIGMVAMFQAHRGSARWAWVLPLALALTAIWSVVLLRRTAGWNPWLAWAVGAVTVVAVAGLIIGRLGRRAGPRLGCGVLALVGALGGPAAYAVDAAGSRVSGTNPLAGPVREGMGGPGGARMPGPGAGASPGARPGGVGPGEAGGAPAGLRGRFGSGRMGGGAEGMVSSQLIAYLEKNQGGARWLVAVSSAQSASAMILKTGRPVIAMSGFTGSDPAMTAGKLRRYVQDGLLHYVLTGDRMGRGRQGDADVTAWLRQSCKVVPPGEYGGGVQGSDTPSMTGGELYRCG